MGFFHIEQKAKNNNAAMADGISIELLHRCECTACPLRLHHAELRHPNMQPFGTKKPLVYFLGEAPGADEDKQGKPFVGKAGSILRMRLEPEWLPLIRWNNVVRTRPPDNRDPTRAEMEACRPSIIRDIVATKPKAIFGFGNIPLKWATGQAKITIWRGRRFPIDVGGHKCWFFPMYHPSYIAHTRNWTPYGDGYGSDLEFAFHMDLKKAFAALDDLPDPIIYTKEKLLQNVRAIFDPDEAITAIRAAYTEPNCGLDYETTALRPFASEAKILSVGLATAAEAIAFPIDHSQCTWSEKDKVRVWNEFETFLYEAPCRKIAHHLPFEMEWSAFFFGSECLHRGNWGCSESQAYILDERSDKAGGGRSLDFLFLQNFGLSLKAITGNLDRLNLDKAPLPKVLEYNALDAKGHRLLFRKQTKTLEAEGLQQVYEYQLHRSPSIVLSQIGGVPTNAKETERLYSKYRNKLIKIEAEIAELKAAKRFRQLTSHDYRPSAIKDVMLICRRVLNEPVEKADEASLATLKKHPIIRLTLAWRKTNKLLSTYIIPLRPDSPHMFPDKRIHPLTLITSTDTWRTSQEDPNCQNWPTRDRIAKEVRRQIEAAAGWKIISIDYASIQARNVAMETKDQTLVDAFWNDYDIHADWRDRIQKEYPQWMSKAERNDPDAMKLFRNVAKNGIVFPSFFGAQVKKVAKVLKIPEKEAANLHRDFWREFPDIKQWHERIHEHYKEHGYVTGLSGFRRRYPISPNQLINAPIQADEALIVCESMYRLSKTNDDYLQAMLEIHDDLTFLVPNKKVDHLIDIITREMTRPVFDWFNVPIVCEVKIGQNWGEMEELKEKFSSEQLWGHKRHDKKSSKKSTVKSDHPGRGLNRWQVT